MRSSVNSEFSVFFLFFVHLFVSAHFIFHLLISPSVSIFLSPCRSCSENIPPGQKMLQGCALLFHAREVDKRAVVDKPGVRLSAPCLKCAVLMQSL